MVQQLKFQSFTTSSISTMLLSSSYHFMKRVPALTKFIADTLAFKQSWMIKRVATVQDAGTFVQDRNATQRHHKLVDQPRGRSVLNPLQHGTVSTILRVTEDDDFGVVCVVTIFNIIIFRICGGRGRETNIVIITEEY